MNAEYWRETAAAASQPLRLPWPRISFAMLCLCWLWLLGLPCLRQHDAMRFADDMVPALMAFVILLALHTAWCGGETFRATLFAVAELLYCGAH